MASAGAFVFISTHCKAAAAIVMVALAVRQRSNVMLIGVTYISDGDTNVNQDGCRVVSQRSDFSGELQLMKKNNFQIKRH